MIHSDQRFIHPGAGERHTYRLRLRSGRHDWRFVYTSGDELQMIEAITAMARDPDCPLEWSAASRLMRAIGGPASNLPPPDGASSPTNQRELGED